MIEALKPACGCQKIKRAAIIAVALAFVAFHVWAYMQPDTGGVPAPVSAPGMLKGRR